MYQIWQTVSICTHKLKKKGYSLERYEVCGQKPKVGNFKG